MAKADDFCHIACAITTATTTPIGPREPSPTSMPITSVQRTTEIHTYHQLNLIKTSPKTLISNNSRHPTITTNLTNTTHHLILINSPSVLDLENHLPNPH
ncbi:hypothetical protein M758_4G035100 [Ceratodon purpureus]|nr:hypothetical protein M758_4G035100 [Ceratodon purpureus]